MFLKPGAGGLEICGNPSCRNSKRDFWIGVPAHISWCVESPQHGFDPPGGYALYIRRWRPSTKKGLFFHFPGHDSKVTRPNIGCESQLASLSGIHSR
jgi:hypothetical protein